MKNSKIKMTQEVTKNVNLDEFTNLKMYDCNDMIEVTGSRNHNSPWSYIKRYDENHYIYLSTGELRKYNRGKKRSYNKNNLQKTFKKLKRIISANFMGNPNERHLVLKYKEPMFNSENLYSDYKSFWEKLKRQYPNHEYLRIAEPHKNGSWHLHILIKDTVNEKFSIPNEKLVEFWGKGEVYDSPIYNAKAIRFYFYPSSKKSSTPGMQEKARRLKFYPKDLNIYTKSKGIITPKGEKKIPNEIREATKCHDLTFSVISNITSVNPDGEEVLVNKILNQQYDRNSNSVNQISQPELSGNGKKVDE